MPDEYKMFICAVGHVWFADPFSTALFEIWQHSCPTCFGEATWHLFTKDVNEIPKPSDLKEKSSKCKCGKQHFEAPKTVGTPV